MNGSGFGICGHRNAYQSRVRHGNWVEDLIGIDLHAQGFERGKVTGDDYMTTSAGSYIHPADMVNKQDQGLAPPTMPDPNGLSYLYRGLDQKLVGVEHVEPIHEVIA